MVRTPTMRRPRASRSSARRAASTSGSSGMAAERLAPGGAGCPMGAAELGPPEAVDGVVVHHSRRLHERITDGGADEPKPAVAQLPAECSRGLGFRRHLFPRAPRVL